MPTAKDIRVAPIARADADRTIKRLHYSGKVVNNSQLHLGVFLDGRLEGAMQFGPSLDKRKIQGLVAGTGWNEFIELNRMAFGSRLPRNSESRALGVAFRLIRREYPHLRWCVSFADATQCGDGTIYRASGFVLTGLNRNDQIWEAPTGEVFLEPSIKATIGGAKERARARQVFSRTSLTDGRSKQQQQQAKAILSRTTTTKGTHILDTGAASMKVYRDAGWKPKPGFQLRYIYFLDPAARERLTVPVIPFSEIEKRGARMYLGQRVGSDTIDTPAVQAGEGGETPTPTLQTSCPS